MTIRNHRQLIQLGLTSLALTLILACPTASQAQRRDFAGTYQFNQVAQGADTTSLTIILTLRNYSGSEIDNAGVILYDSSSTPVPNPSARGSAHGEPVAGFDLIRKLPDLTEVTSSHRFTISTREYLLWQQGRQPRLMFLKPESGGTQIVPIDLHREFGPTAGTQQNNVEVAR